MHPERGIAFCIAHCLCPVLLERGPLHGGQRAQSELRITDLIKGGIRSPRIRSPESGIGILAEPDHIRPRIIEIISGIVRIALSV